MLEKQHTGIILYLNNIAKKVTIFDYELGKLDFYLSFDEKDLKLSNGALVAYYLDTKNNKVKLKKISVVDVPFKLARENILFLHHILELAYYFIPAGMALTDLFDLLYFGIYSYDELSDIDAQRIFIAKFFLCLGVYPENEAMKSCFFKIMTIPIDSIGKATIDLDKEKELSLWIEKCVYMHPYSRSFKTTHFLNKL